MSKAIASLSVASLSADTIGQAVIQAAKNAHAEGKPEASQLRVLVMIEDEFADQFTLLSEKGKDYASCVQLIKHALKGNPTMGKNKAIEFAAMVNPKMDKNMIADAYDEAAAKVNGKGKAVKEEAVEEKKTSKPKANLIKKAK